MLAETPPFFYNTFALWLCFDFLICILLWAFSIMLEWAFLLVILEGGSVIRTSSQSVFILFLLPFFCVGVGDLFSLYFFDYLIRVSVMEGSPTPYCYTARAANTIIERRIQLTKKKEKIKWKRCSYVSRYSGMLSRMCCDSLTCQNQVSVVCPHKS